VSSIPVFARFASATLPVGRLQHPPPPILNMWKTCVAVSLTLSGASVCLAQGFSEVGDAGKLPCTAQIAAGTGSLTTITGAIAFGDVDMYQIFVTGGGTFSASAGGESPGYALDPVLFLFDANGRGVYANDDAWPPDPFFPPGRALLPAGQALTPLMAGVYFLAIAPSDIFPVSAGGRIFPFSPTGTDVLGPTGPGGALPASGWSGSFFSTGSYTITLTGAEFTSIRATTFPAVVPGRKTTFTLANADDGLCGSMQVVAGHSYCAQLAAGPTAPGRAQAYVSAYRADGTTQIGGFAATSCFIAPGTETALLQVTQFDASARSYALSVVETTLWANWFFIAGDYSSFTLLRNTTASTITATVTWRSDGGTIVGVETVAIPSGGVYFRDARATTSGASAGSIEVAHNGEPGALVGSQTTLSATTGLSFDTHLMHRSIRR
jgi:hypothetical protein